MRLTGFVIFLLAAVVAAQETSGIHGKVVDAATGAPIPGAEVTSVRIYQWALPEDMGPLREAVMSKPKNFWTNRALKLFSH